MQANSRNNQITRKKVLPHTVAVMQLHLLNRLSNSPAAKLPFEEESFTLRGKNEIRTIVSTYHEVHFKMWTQVAPDPKFKMAANLP